LTFFLHVPWWPQIVINWLRRRRSGFTVGYIPPVRTQKKNHDNKKLVQEAAPSCQHPIGSTFPSPWNRLNKLSCLWDVTFKCLQNVCEAFVRFHSMNCNGSIFWLYCHRPIRLRADPHSHSKPRCHLNHFN